MSVAEVVLHIGAFKTGTSFIQQALALNKQRLADDGVLFPGASWPEQVHAVRALTARPDPAQPRDERGGDAWDRIAEECRSSDLERAVISMEFLSAARVEAIAEAVRSLAPAQVRVVLGVRDLSYAIPAQWQESLQSGGRTWTLSEYAAGVMRPVGRFNDATRHFWRKHNWQRVLTRWSQATVGRRPTVVTFPRPGSPPELLWHRFGVAAGFDATAYPIPSPTNESLGAASLEVARRINLLAISRGTTTRGNPVYRRVVCKRVMAQRRPAEIPVTLPPSARDWAVTRTEQLVRKLSAIDPVVVGDLDDVRPRPSSANRVATWQPELTHVADLADAAEHAAAGLAEALGRAAAPGTATETRLGAEPRGRSPQQRLDEAIAATLAMVAEQP